MLHFANVHVRDCFKVSSPRRLVGGPCLTRHVRGSPSAYDPRTASAHPPNNSVEWNWCQSSTRACRSVLGDTRRSQRPAGFTRSMETPRTCAPRLRLQAT